MTTQPASGLPVGRDADAVWIDHQVATRLFGAMPRQIGRYTILETLGSGGMGLVYRAHDAQLGRMIAVKLLNADHSTSDGARLMQREAQAMARLSHAHVVQVYEVGQYREQVFLAMEYVDGETLEAWLRREQRPRVILSLFRGIGEGVAAAHAVGITHRDLKPANILVDGTGRPRVADFGLARTDAPLDLERAPTLGDSQGDNSRITAVGQILGTPRYMSPEQHAGVQATARSDQFSFCMMLWEALCGELPFPERDGNGALHGTWTLRPPPRKRQLSYQVRTALTRGLQVDPGLRWQSMAELLTALGRPSRLKRLSWLLIPLGLAAGVGFGAMFDPFGATDASPRRAVCDPAVDALLQHERAQMFRWRTALAVSAHPPEVRRYLGNMLDEWSAEVHAVCDASLQSDSPRHSRELLRRGACVAQGAGLLQLWLAADEAVRRPPEVADARHTSGPKRPVRLDVEGLGDPCLLSDDQAYDLFRGAAPPDRGHITQELLSVRVLLHLGRPREALARLAALRRYGPAILPASYYLLQARALAATGSDTAKILDTLYIAEDEAELSDDLYALFDARVEQVRVALDAQATAQQYHQVAPLPALGDRWERKLANARTTLRQLELEEGDEMLRLLKVGVDLAASQRKKGRPVALRRQLVAAADRYGSARLRSEIYSDHAGTVAGTEAAAFDAKAIAIAPADDEFRGYLNYKAAMHALDRGDVGLGVSYLQASMELYRRAFGPAAPQLGDLTYTIAQALHMAGESVAALDAAGAAVRANERLGPTLELATALQLRSAIQVRLGAGTLAARDADAALAALPTELDSQDFVLWRATFQAAVVESRVALGAFAEAIQLAQAAVHELDAHSDLDSGEPRDELQLAAATALLGLGRPREAAQALTRATRPDFLGHDDFKRADAMLLRARLPGGAAADRRRWQREALALLKPLGRDGGRRIAAMHVTDPK